MRLFALVATRAKSASHSLSTRDAHSSSKNCTALDACSCHFCPATKVTKSAWRCLTTQPIPDRLGALRAGCEQRSAIGHPARAPTANIRVGPLRASSVLSAVLDGETLGAVSLEYATPATISSAYRCGFLT